MRWRTALLAGVLATTAAAPATADAAKRKRAKPALAVASLVVPGSRAALDPDATFTLSGRVANRSRRARRAVLSFSLRTRRSRRGNAYRVGARNVLTLGPRTARRFRTTLLLPASFPLRPGRRLYVSACVRRRASAPARCRTSRRTIVFGPRRTGGDVLRPPAPPGAPPAAPAAPSTPPPAGPAAPTHTPGARTAGDRLFPEIGNGGYDVQHYDIDLQYEPLTDLILATTAIEAKATQNLSEYSFDLLTMDAGTVKVDGADAAFRQEGNKLIVTPPAPIDNGRTFTTTIGYGGTATPYEDPDGSFEGFLPTADGAYVVNEPLGAMTWFPNNNVPTDKALYDMRITVPASMTAFGNGRLVKTEITSGGQSVWHWREDSPMATYLSTATNGTFTRTTDTSDPDIPYEYGVDPSSPGAPAVPLEDLELSPGITDFFETTLGVPYPFTSSGGVNDMPPPALAAAPYALESQTRPMYLIKPGPTTVAHEIAHQWFGNSVSPAQWADIWLNEGPAEFFSWLWDERGNAGDTTTAEQFAAGYADADFDWSIPPANPRADQIFEFDPMYRRGAMVMEALRQILGEQRFLAVCRRWLELHRHEHGSTAEFIALVKAEGGVDPERLQLFFAEWLYGTKKPGITPDNFLTYAP